MFRKSWTQAAAFATFAVPLVLVAAVISAIVDFAPMLTGAVPDFATWTLMILGFGTIGTLTRRRKTVRVSFI